VEAWGNIDQRRKGKMRNQITIKKEEENEEKK